jgi:hypothetical protein
LVFAGQWSSAEADARRLSDDTAAEVLGAKLLGLAEAGSAEISARRLGAKIQPVGLGLAEAAAAEISEAAEAAAAKLGTTASHCAAHHHLSVAHASVGHSARDGAREIESPTCLGAQVRGLGIYGRLLYSGALKRHRRRIHDDDDPTAVCHQCNAPLPCECVCVCVVYFLVRNFTGDCFFSETESCVFVSLQLQHVGLFESLQLVPARQSKKLKEDGSVNQSSLLILYTAKS